MNDDQKGGEGWRGEAVPAAVEEKGVETYLRRERLHGLSLLFVL